MLSMSEEELLGKEMEKKDILGLSVALIICVSLFSLYVYMEFFQLCYFFALESIRLDKENEIFVVRIKFFGNRPIYEVNVSCDSEPSLSIEKLEPEEIF